MASASARTSIRDLSVPFITVSAVLERRLRLGRLETA